jgi:hypothetical protein
LTGSSGDYTDLGIGRKFGGAAAAYSLRDIGAMNGPVVRVRRDSDNSEQDFSALAVPFIPDWCNRQVVKPLDVKALQSDGRTGDFIIAKAAYSLRSLGDRQATVAATNDTVARADGKYVVQVRRSSDDTIKSFTADEVTDGTLVTFVGSGNDGMVRTWYDQSVTDQGGGTATGNHAVQATADNQPKVVNNGSLVTGGIDFDGTNDSLVLSSALGITSTMGAYVVTDTSGANSAGIIFDNRDGGNEGFAIRMNSSTQIQFDYDATDVVISEGSIQSIYFANKSSSAAGFALNGASLTTTSTSDTIDISNVPKIGTRSFTSDTNFYDKPIAEIVVFTGDQTDNRGAFEANVGDHYNISGIPTQENIVNGFVETWYDQSGNGKDLTQTTANKQPKIVDTGSLVTLSGKPSIKPDGSDDFLINQDSIWDTISNSALSCFTVTEKSTVTNKQLWAIGSTADNDGDWLMGGASTAGNVQFRGARFSSNIVNTGTSGTMLLTAFDVTGGDAFINGSAMGVAASGSPSTTADRLVLFARREGDSFTTQKISEAIFFANDQASNRVDIETNMNNFYSIF